MNVPSGPLSGRVISRDDLVITPDGIDVKQTDKIKSKTEETTRPTVSPLHSFTTQVFFFI